MKVTLICNRLKRVNKYNCNSKWELLFIALLRYGTKCSNNLYRYALAVTDLSTEVLPVPTTVTEGGKRQNITQRKPNTMPFLFWITYFSENIHCYQYVFFFQNQHTVCQLSPKDLPLQRFRNSCVNFFICHHQMSLMVPRLQQCLRFSHDDIFLKIASHELHLIYPI